MTFLNQSKQFFRLFLSQRYYSINNILHTIPPFVRGGIYKVYKISENFKITKYWKVCDMENGRTILNIAITLILVIVVLVYTRHIEEESMWEGYKQGYDVGHSEGYDEGYSEAADYLTEERKQEIADDSYMYGYYRGYNDKTNGLPYDESVGRPAENNGWIPKEGE